MQLITLVGNKVRLRAFSISDAEELANLANNKKIWDNVRDHLPHPYLKKDAISFIKLCNKEKVQSTFAVEFENQFSGVIGLVLQSDVYRHSAEVGYWIGEPYWNKGLATEALKLIVNYAFESLKLVRVFARTFDFNKPSHRVLEKAGFNFEANLKKAVIKNNNICGEIIYAILAKEDQTL